MHISSDRTVFRALAGAVLGIAMAVASGTASAVAGGYTPNYPPGPHSGAYQVGEVISATIVLQNATPAVQETLQVSDIKFTPSCKDPTAGASGFCDLGFEDPGVFDLGSGSTSTSGACSGVSFTFSAPDATTGEVTMTASGAWTLGYTGVGQTLCTIHFNATVLKVPVDSESGNPGVQTEGIGIATFTGTVSGPDSATSATGGTTATILAATPSLSITKTPDGQSITAGTAATFAITVSNAGPGTATAVTLNDPLPGNGGVLWSIVGSPGGGCQITGAQGSQVLSCPSIGDLASGASFPVSVTATTSAQVCATWSNTATANATNNNQVQDSGSISCTAPSLQVTKTPTATPVSAGSPITFNIVVTNTSGVQANSVTLTDTLPGGVTWSIVGSPGGGCNISSGVLSCPSIGNLAAGASFPVSVTATTSANACTTYNNTAVASASNAPNAQGSGQIVCQTPSLSINKTPDGQSITPGAAATFAITVSNGGPGTAAGVAINDPLPGASGISWSIVGSPGGGCQISGAVGSQVLSCPSIGNLASGASFPVSVTASTSTQVCATWNNTATATATNSANTPQDSGSISCSVAPPPPPPRTDVPTLGEYALITLMLLLGALGAFYTRRQRS